MSVLLTNDIPSHTSQSYDSDRQSYAVIGGGAHKTSGTYLLPALERPKRLSINSTTAMSNTVADGQPSRERNLRRHGTEPARRRGSHFILFAISGYLLRAQYLTIT
ncbi:unnamed protein product [Anisakis simplex]|uniref:Uncharacterized protein n=1 Tax=Anisakis simplex TaxID=6269 RepID=A0A0M3IYZ2_ANISI|nr:unnamed protein product [Anisakis simplex]